METMKAVKVLGLGKAKIQNVPWPKLRDDYILCKVKQVALNPTDWKHIDRLGPVGATVGCDFVGIVVAVGSKVNKSWEKGARIAAFVHGCNSDEIEDGCFAEYAVAKGDFQMRVPDNLSDQQACTLGVGLTTVGQGLFQSLGLTLQEKAPAGTTLLVYGGSTATGSLAIQFGVRSGCTVITTCSPRNFQFVKSLGASKAFNYKTVDCGKLINDFTNNKLALAFDTISEKSSSEICCDAISSAGGKISYLQPMKHKRDDVASESTLAYSICGETFHIASTIVQAKPEDFEFGCRFWNYATDLFSRDEIIAHPVKEHEGGLDEILFGLEQLREGISRKKLVYRISD